MYVIRLQSFSAPGSFCYVCRGSVFYHERVLKSGQGWSWERATHKASLFSSITEAEQARADYMAWIGPDAPDQLSERLRDAVVLLAQTIDPTVYCIPDTAGDKKKC